MVDSKQILIILKSQSQNQKKKQEEKQFLSFQALSLSFIKFSSFG